MRGIVHQAGLAQLRRHHLHQVAGGVHGQRRDPARAVLNPLQLVVAVIGKSHPAVEWVFDGRDSARRAVVQHRPAVARQVLVAAHRAAGVQDLEAVRLGLGEGAAAIVRERVAGRARRQEDAVDVLGGVVQQRAAAVGHILARGGRGDGALVQFGPAGTIGRGRGVERVVDQQRGRVERAAIGMLDGEQHVAVGDVQLHRPKVETRDVRHQHVGHALQDAEGRAHCGLDGRRAREARPAIGGAGRGRGAVRLPHSAPHPESRMRSAKRPAQAHRLRQRPAACPYAAHVAIPAPAVAAAGARRAVADRPASIERAAQARQADWPDQCAYGSPQQQTRHAGGKVGDLRQIHHRRDFHRAGKIGALRVRK